MELRDLTTYAHEKYHIQEEHKWADFPGFSVLSHPVSHKWIALLMRQWDTERGMELEFCDLKCGTACLREFQRPYLSEPLRMRSTKWISVTFDSRTEEAVVEALLDRAYRGEEHQGFTITLETGMPRSSVGEKTGGVIYHDTALPFERRGSAPERETLPERLRQMRRMYEYGYESREERARNFYRQGKFMEDYEDEAPWRGNLVTYYPTYHDLTTQQLRGYFSWRTHLRKGDFQPVPDAVAYIYIYELLNGIGAKEPEERLRKLLEFEQHYIGKGYGNPWMRQNLRHWMLDLSVVLDLPADTAKQYMSEELLLRDRSILILREPESHTDEEVFSALCFFNRGKLEKSPVVTKSERGKSLFAAAWRKAAAAYCFRDRDLFTLCFGKLTARQWQPFSNAVYYFRTGEKDREYRLDECRAYSLKDGVWYAEAYEKLYTDTERLRGLLHEADCLFRQYVKTGRYLKEKPENAWAAPYAEAVIEEDRAAVLDAARPKITIDFSGLERIRQDAEITRDSLLLEEDLPVKEELLQEEDQKPEEGLKPEISPEAEADAPEEDAGPLTPLQREVLRLLLRGEHPEAMLRGQFRMPSIVADEINEALFDEIGDTVVFCEDDVLFLVEDYREEITQMVKGST